MRILNLYAGLGGNRKYWGSGITAIEKDERIAMEYKKQFSSDTVIITDAHLYLQAEYKNFNFIWSSPPCQSHTKLILSGRNRTPKYADLRLYEEIIFLQTHSKELWVVENVVPYYEPLVKPSAKIGRHLFWSNFAITEFSHPSTGKLLEMSINDLQNWLGLRTNIRIYYDGNHDSRQVYRNCVHPQIGLHIYNCAMAAIKGAEISYPSTENRPQVQQLSIF